MHGVGAVVFGQDHPEVVGGGVFGAAAHVVERYVSTVVVLVGFIVSAG